MYILRLHTVDIQCENCNTLAISGSHVIDQGGQSTPLQ
jgi:hypothetical protein